MGGKGKRGIDSYRRRYLLLKGFLRWKQAVINSLLSGRLLLHRQLRPDKGVCFLDYLLDAVKHPDIKKQIRLLVLLREQLVKAWKFEIQKDLSAFNRLDPSGVAASKAWQKLRQAIDAFGGYSTDSNGSIRMFKMRLFKDMQRIRNHIVILSRMVSRRDSFEGPELSEEILVEHTTPEDILLMKEELRVCF